MNAPNFHLSQQVFQVIMAGLNELPARIANPVLSELQQQAEKLNAALKEQSQAAESGL
jgi:hypothetical protein